MEPLIILTGFTQSHLHFHLHLLRWSSLLPQSRSCQPAGDETRVKFERRNDQFKFSLATQWLENPPLSCSIMSSIYLQPLGQ